MLRHFQYTKVIENRVTFYLFLCKESETNMIQTCKQNEQENQKQLLCVIQLIGYAGKYHFSHFSLFQLNTRSKDTCRSIMKQIFTSLQVHCNY